MNVEQHQFFSQAKTRSGEKSCKEAEIAIIEQYQAHKVVLLLFGTIPILRFTLCAQFQKIILPCKVSNCSKVNFGLLIIT